MAKLNFNVVEKQLVPILLSGREKMSSNVKNKWENNDKRAMLKNVSSAKCYAINISMKLPFFPLSACSHLHDVMEKMMDETFCRRQLLFAFSRLLKHILSDDKDALERICMKSDE